MSIREMVPKWAGKIGENNAKAKLVKRGIAGNSADKLVAGTYPNEPRGAYAAAIIEEMAKDGFSLADDEAS